jgi:predicted ATPase
MTISKFKFKDQSRKWELKEVSFSDFNLLVGQSGVGKTKILNSIHAVCKAAVAETDKLPNCKWELEVVVEGDNYIWEAETEANQVVDSEKLYVEQTASFLMERITKNKSETIVDRSKGKFVFRGMNLPKLSNNASAITLLREEDSILKLNQSLSNIRLKFSNELAHEWMQGWLFFVILDENSVHKARERNITLSKLRVDTETAFLMKAYILQEDYPQEFLQLKQDFLEIFPSIDDVKIATSSYFNTSNKQQEQLILPNILSIGIKEQGVSKWIQDFEISSGMLKAFLHLLEIALSPPNTAILIDEFENSLGVNCLPLLTDRILRRTDMQFILTSHHPYVINNIPWKYWKLVTRKRSEVTVKDASLIPALNSSSSLQRFTQLMNLEEYEEAIG